MAQVEVAQESKCPVNTPFKQQQLPSMQPAMSPLFVIGSFIVFGILFIILGTSLIVGSDNIQSIEMRYDHLQSCPWSARAYRPGWSCEPLVLNFTITRTMKAPIFLYYKIANFNQNNRRFVRSISYTQLSGRVDYSAAEQNDCQPFTFPSQFVDFSSSPASEMYVNLSTPGNSLSIAEAKYFPCGLVPWSMFNDSISLLSAPTASHPMPTLMCDGSAFDDLGNPTNVENHGKCEKRGIAWSTVAGVIYKPVPDLSLNPTILTHRGWPAACSQLVNYPNLVDQVNDEHWSIYACNGWYLGEPGHRIPNPLDEDLWVWNRIASYSTFKKLYRRIVVDLPPGTYQFRVVQRWDISAFDGEKYLVLETTGWMGSKNYFLGALFLAAGCLSILLAIAFVAKHWAQPPRLAN